MQLYTDISAEWVTGDNSQLVNWSTSSGDIVTHQVELQDQTNYLEVSDHIHCMSLHSLLNPRLTRHSWFHVLFHQIGEYTHFPTLPPLTQLQASGLTYQTGSDESVRTQFVQNGVLLNTQDTDYRAVNDKWPIFALARDMGNVTGATEPFVMSVGHVRDPAVQYVVSGGALQDRSLYFWSAYASVADAVSIVLVMI